MVATVLGSGGVQSLVERAGDQGWSRRFEESVENVKEWEGSLEGYLETMLFSQWFNT